MFSNKTLFGFHHTHTHIFQTSLYLLSGWVAVWMHYSSGLFQFPCFSGSRADNEHATVRRTRCVNTCSVSSLFPSFAALSLTATVITLPLPVSLRKLKCLNTALWSRMLWTFIILSTRWHVTPKLGINSIWNQWSWWIMQWHSVSHFLLSHLFPAVSAGVAITKICWLAVTMRGLSFFGMGSQVRGQRSTRYPYVFGCTRWHSLFLYPFQ